MGEENVAISRDDLLDELISMPAVQGSDLSIPLTNSLYVQFTHLLEDEQKKCHALAQEYIKRAKEQGEEFKESMYAEKMVQFYLYALKFLRA